MKQVGAAVPTLRELEAGPVVPAASLLLDFSICTHPVTPHNYCFFLKLAVLVDMQTLSARLCVGLV